MKNAWAFYRRSTNMQEVSIDDQRAACRAKAAEMGCVISREFVPPKGYASGLTIDKDPGFREMLRLAEAGGHGASCLIIYSVSRFGRLDPEAKIYWEQRFKKQGGLQIIYVKDDFKNDGSIGDVIMRAVKHSEAHQYSIKLSEDTLRGCKTHAARGTSCGGRAPYGYDRMIMDASGAEVKRLGPGQHKADKLQRIVWVPGDPQKVKVVLSIFEMSNRGKGLFTIVDELNKQGIAGPAGGAWSKNQVHYLLRNVAYIGTRVYNKHSFHDRTGATKRGSIKPQEQWIVCEDAHEAIVPKELFLSVHAKLKSRPFGHGAANRRKNWLLSGLVVCQECGHRFQGFTKKGNGRTAEYYVCGGYVMKGTQVCKSIHVPREALELFVIETIRRRISDKEWMDGLRERIDQVVETELREKPGLTAEDIQDSLARNQKQIDNLLDAIKNGLLSPFVREELGRLEAARRQLMEEKDNILKRRCAHIAVDEVVREMKELLGEFEGVIQNGNNSERKAFLRAFLYETRISHASGRPQATHYFYKVPRPQKEVTEGRHPTLASAFGNAYLTKLVAGAGFEPATSRL